jgi:hypothetical protein
VQGEGTRLWLGYPPCQVGEHAIAVQDLAPSAMLSTRHFRPLARCCPGLFLDLPVATPGGAAGCRRAPRARHAACSHCPEASAPSAHPHSVQAAANSQRAGAATNPPLRCVRQRLSVVGHLQALNRAAAIATGCHKIADHVARKRRLPSTGKPAEEHDAAPPPFRHRGANWGKRKMKFTTHTLVISTELLLYLPGFGKLRF